MHFFAREGIRLDDRSMVGVLVRTLFFVFLLHERAAKEHRVFDFKLRRAWHWRCGSSVGSRAFTSGEVFIAVKNGSLLFDSLSVSTVQLTSNRIMP